MRERIEDFPHIPVGESILVISYGSEAIESFMLPSIIFEDKHVDTIVEDEFSFDFESIEYQIDVFSSNAGTQITISTEYNDSAIDDFEMEIEEIPPEEANKVTYYVPTAPFTKTLSSALYGLADDTTIIPMIDVENENKFNDYLEDDLVYFTHFLDISSLKYVVNQELREQVKEERKQEKKDIGHMSTPLPPVEEDVISLDEKVKKYKLIKDKEKVIPVYLWNEHATISDLIYFVQELQEDFPRFSIRILDKNTFLDNIKKIKLIYEFIIFMDLNTNFNTKNIKTYLDKFLLYFDDIIYLGAHFLSSQMSVPPNALNKNHVRENFPMAVYQELLKYFSNLKYGDYCGFDRKTLSSLPKGGRPSARVILEDLDCSKKILIRRGWDDKDKTISKESGKIRLGVIHSMHKLLCDIQNGVLDQAPQPNGNIFMDEIICDADDALKSYCPERTTPGEVKTLCIRHNIISVKHNYM
jgi:hypothetical protein